MLGVSILFLELHINALERISNIHFPLQVSARRVTFRRRHCYSTKSNKTKAVKTPGDRLVVHYLSKKASAPKCGDCGNALGGVSRNLGCHNIAPTSHHHRLQDVPISVDR